MSEQKILYSGATISPCQTWRYCLWRIWDGGKLPAMFIGLNPSTADEYVDDPTIRRCMNFARSWGFGGIWMLNLFAYRSTDPRALRIASDPIGPENDHYVLRTSSQAGVVVAAWGTHGDFMGRSEWARTNIKNLKCLGVTKSGEPRHPLYLPKTLVPSDFGLTEKGARG